MGLLELIYLKKPLTLPFRGPLRPGMGYPLLKKRLVLLKNRQIGSKFVEGNCPMIYD
jgi:hypothetical protein